VVVTPNVHEAVTTFKKAPLVNVAQVPNRRQPIKVRRVPSFICRSSNPNPFPSLKCIFDRLSSGGCGGCCCDGGGGGGLNPMLLLRPETGKSRRTHRIAAHTNSTVELFHGRKKQVWALPHP